MRHRLLVLLLVTLWLAGCSVAQRYPNEMAKNLTVNLHLVKNGGIFTSAEAVVGINNYAKDCTNDYKGYVDLNEGANEIGLQVGQPTVLIVEITHKSMGSSGGVQRGALITPKAGARYQIDANYVDGMFDFRLYEIGSKGKKPLEITTTLPGCKS